MDKFNRGDTVTITHISRCHDLWEAKATELGLEAIWHRGPPKTGDQGVVLKKAHDEVGRVIYAVVIRGRMFLMNETGIKLDHTAADVAVQAALGEAWDKAQQAVYDAQAALDKAKAALSALEV